MNSLIKIFDKRVADALRDSGFYYIEENFNNEQTVYAFENSSELREVLEEYLSTDEFGEIAFVVESSITL